MNPRREQVAARFAKATERIDALLSTWGFSFALGEIQSSHCGPYATGAFTRGQTKISVSCRDTIDNLFYEHTFVTQYSSYTERERYSIGHAALMDAVGHADDCRLIVCDKIPDAIVARDGGDRVDALIHDLNVLASSVLREPCDEFYAIVRRGFRSYSIA